MVFLITITYRFTPYARSDRLGALRLLIFDFYLTFRRVHVHHLHLTAQVAWR